MPAESIMDVLRTLAVSQEAHYADFAKYAPSLDRLSFSSPPGISIMLTSTDPQDWAAVARRSDWPGRSCVIWVGPVPDRLIPRTDHLGRQGREGAITCDS